MWALTALRKENNTWGASHQAVATPYSEPQGSSVQWLSRVWLFETWWTAALQTSLSITTFQSLLKLTSIKSVMPSNHRILCCPLPRGGKSPLTTQDHTWRSSSTTSSPVNPRALGFGSFMAGSWPDSLLFTTFIWGEFPDGPVVKNSPSSAADVNSIPGQGTNTPHMAEPPSPHARTREPTCRYYWAPSSGAPIPQLQRSCREHPLCHN